MLVINAKKLRALRTGECALFTHKKSGKPLKGQGDVSCYVTRVTQETGRKFSMMKYILVEQTMPLAMNAIMIRRD